ncbi:MAG: DUF4428 domain-containing protein [Lachnospiraceae bacterium]|nr:DUF4428 domain-containing protein [Lachnospiraceae bacterium]
MGLFSKKACSVCGGNMGIVTDNKLADGGLCHDCAKKLSPWFSGMKQTTIEQIKEQLAFREENKAKVMDFHPTRSYGQGRYKILIDEDNRKFMVTDAADIVGANPDVLDLTDVTNCDMEIKEDQREIYRQGADGKSVSYNPKRYKYTYNFYITINVNHPYFNVIRFQLNNKTIEMESQIERQVGGGPMGAMFNAMTRPGQPSNMGGIRGAAAQRARTGGMLGNTVTNSYKPDPMMDPVYAQCAQQGAEIREALLNARYEARAEAMAAAAPKAAVTCPYCGATTTPDASGCCEYCGGAVN